MGRVLTVLAAGAFFAGCAHKKPLPPRAAPPAAADPVALATTGRTAASAVEVALSTSATIQDLLSGIEAAYRSGRYNDGLTLVRRTLETRRKDLSIYDRVGSVYYLLGRYGEALSVWEQALNLEKRPRRRMDLANSIAMARRTLGLPEPTPAPGAPPVKRPRRRPAPSKKQPPDPKVVEWFYDQGVKHYAKGEYLEAATSFYRVLELDPEHVLAKSALARLKLKPGATEIAPPSGRDRRPDTPPEENGPGGRENGTGARNGNPG